jgi:hypothetical protein
MKWVVLAIIVLIVPYTYLRWHYRKPTKPFEPYTELRDRANTLRLLSAGFQRIALNVQRPADPALALMTAPAESAPGGLPDVLRTSLVDQPRLPADILRVAAAPSVESGQSYSVQFTCTLPDDRQQLGAAQLYLRKGEIFLVPQLEQLTGGLLTRSRESVVLLTVPAGALKPGNYRATLLGTRGSKAWTVQVH